MIHYKGSGHLHINAYECHTAMCIETVDNFIINCCTLLNNKYCLEWNFDNKHNDFIECGTLSYISFPGNQKLFKLDFKDFNILRSIRNTITNPKTIYFINPKTMLGYWLCITFLSRILKIKNKSY